MYESSEPAPALICTKPAFQVNSASASHQFNSMRSFFILFGLFLGVLSPCALCQQSYYRTRNTEDCTVEHPENAGYVCEAGATSCDTVAYFRVQSGSFSSLNAIAKQLFNTTPSAIASASGLSNPDASVSRQGQALYIPMTCTCYGSHSSYNVSYTIQAGNTFDVLANNTYEGLTTCQAIQDANPTLVVTDLQIGQVCIFPIRCACPSEEEKLSGVRSLVTYPVADGDDVNSVVRMFGVVEQQFLAANGISNTSVPLFAATTVLVPFLVNPTSPPNTTSQSPSPSSPVLGGSSSHSSKAGMYAGVSVGCAAALLAVAVGIFFCLRRKRRGLPSQSLSKTSPPHDEKRLAPLKSEEEWRKVHESVFDFAGSDKFRSYTLEEIKQATQDFSPTTHIRGAVYRGVLKGEVVAVKIVTRNVSKELQILKKVHHTNLVTLLGSCMASPEHSYLVYQYAENGSLSDWLHEELTVSSGSMSTLAWNHRLQVALDVATALEYIHDHTTPNYVHKDVKSSNILLDSKFRGKLANFALAKSATETEVTRHVVGTQGYMAPEYLSQGVFSSKMDVFAFGVVLLEILSGKEAVMRDRHGKEAFLSNTISNILDDGSDGKMRLKEWMDPKLQDGYPLDCAYSVALLARSCVVEDLSARPHMRSIAYTLAKVLEVSLEWDGSVVLENYADKPLEAR